MHYNQKNHVLRNAFEKSYLLGQLTITIVHENLIFEIGYTYYTNLLFLPSIHFTHFFLKITSLKTYCAYFFSGKLKFSWASKHLISLAQKASLSKKLISTSVNALQFAVLML